MKSQNAEILVALQKGKKLTPSYAITHFRCYRLAARICDLRRLGHNIVTDTKKLRSKRTGRMVQYAVYSMGEL